MRLGERDEALRGVLARLRTYSLTDGGADWLMSLQLDKLPKGQQKWVEENGLYLFSTHKEEWARNRETLRHLNDQGGRPVANIAARNSGLHAKDAPPGQAGGVMRQNYLCKGARCIATSAALQERGLYNGATKDVFDIVVVAGERPPAALPAFVLASCPKYRGPVYSDSYPEVATIAPIERLLDCRCRWHRVVFPLDPSWGVTPCKSHGGDLRRRVRCRVRRLPPSRSVVLEIALAGYTMRGPRRSPPAAAPMGGAGYEPSP